MVDETETPAVETEPAVDPNLGAAQADPGERLTGQLQARARRAGPTAEAALPRPLTDKDYAGIPFGSKYLSSKGETLTKYYRPQSAKDYAAIPEGSEYKASTGEVLTKKRTEPINYTSQTLYNMGVNDRERRKALERSYPGKVRNNPITGELEVVEEDGKIRRPKGFQDSPWATATSEVAPVVLGGLGALAGGSTLIGGALGGAGGAMLGQGFNDVILGLFGVYDRSVTEEGSNLMLAGATATGGALAGRTVAAAAPSIKHGIEYGAPAGIASFLGAEKEGTKMALQLRNKGVLVPPSMWAKEAPAAINIAEVYDPAFRTQQPLRQSAIDHYEKTSKAILKDAGVPVKEIPEKVSEPTAALSLRTTGEALQRRALDQLALVDAELDKKLARQQAALQAGKVVADPNSLARTAVEARKAADAVVKQGFEDIQTDVNTAMTTAKAGHNSGDLWWAIGEKFKLLREGIMAKANLMYGKAYQAAGPHLPEAGDLADSARAVLSELPEGFEGRFPGIVQQIRDLAGTTNPQGQVVKEAVQPTFEQLHHMRTELRANYNYFNLTPGRREGTFKYFAERVNSIIEDDAARPELKQAAKLLREADTFYRESMGPLNERRIQALMDGMKAGMPADPKVLFDLLVKEGRTELANKAREVVGPVLWNGVKAADVQEMLDLSKGLLPGSIDGKKFVSQVLDRHRHNMLEAVHGNAASEKLLRQAQLIEALEGRLEMPVHPGDTLADIVQRAHLSAQAAEAAASKDPLASLTKEMRKIEADVARERRGIHALAKKDPLGEILYDPTMEASKAAEKILNSDDLVLATAMRFNADSPEFRMLQQKALQQLLHGTAEPGERLKLWTEEVQKLLFPGMTLRDLEILGPEMKALFGTKAFNRTAQSMAAQSRINHPWTSIPVIKGATKLIGADVAGRKILGAYYKFVLETFNKPWLIRTVLKGLEGDEVAKQLSRDEMKKIIRRGGGIGAGMGESQYQAPQQPGQPNLHRRPKHALESRATGGPVEAGQPYVVGEDGPEVVVPGQDGQVVPNSVTKVPVVRYDAEGNLVQAGQQQGYVPMPDVPSPPTQPPSPWPPHPLNPGQLAGDVVPLPINPQQEMDHRIELDRALRSLTSEQYQRWLQRWPKAPILPGPGYTSDASPDPVRAGQQYAQNNAPRLVEMQQIISSTKNSAEASALRRQFVRELIANHGYSHYDAITALGGR